jgi:hypothetical protein
MPEDDRRDESTDDVNNSSRSKNGDHPDNAQEDSDPDDGTTDTKRSDKTTFFY